MDKVVQTFLDLAAIDEVYPNEKQVLEFVMRRLKDAGVPYKQDKARNIVATIKGTTDETIALCSHVDIAAPLDGRKIITEGNVIKTDGVSLLGGDDKTAVAAMLELADEFGTGAKKPPKTIQLIFTIGEEAGLKGAYQLDMGLLTARQVLVFDWLGRVNRIITKSPTGFQINVTYIGKDAHPAEWQKGKNAGAALMAVASSLEQGEYVPGVTFNIGIVEIGNARNKIPGLAHLKAEMRSFDFDKVDSAAKEVEQIFRKGAKKHGVEIKLELVKGSAPYKLNHDSTLFAAATSTLAKMNLKPQLEPTYGCFDGNIFAARGLDVVIMGAGYYNPHSPDEYVNIDELTEMFAFIRQVVG